MSFNTFGKIFRFTTWGESHGPAIGCIIDGCPPLIQLNEQDIQKELNKRKPGQSKFTTQRKESDKVEILSGVFEGKTTGTPISLIIYNEDMRSKDYNDIKDKSRPGHAGIPFTLISIIAPQDEPAFLILKRYLSQILSIDLSGQKNGFL